MKTTYRHKQVDEVNWDEEDDDDALILAEQPFETAMQAGWKEYLNHLNTKFVARRSDIIISSTLSITLTPVESNVIPTHFALITPDEIVKFVQCKNDFKAMKITSNVLE